MKLLLKHIVSGDFVIADHENKNGETEFRINQNRFIYCSKHINNLSERFFADLAFLESINYKIVTPDDIRFEDAKDLIDQIQSDIVKQFTEKLEKTYGIPRKHTNATANTSCRCTCHNGNP